MQFSLNHLPCPCGSTLIYQNCCQPYLSNQDIPKIPEALMRSRYTAYSQANMEYIRQTMRGQALIGFNQEETRKWASQVQWLGLKIIATSPIANERGWVEFIASFFQGGRRHIIHERSEFHKIEGRWYYVAGQTPKVNRNNPCPCGSTQKYKRCCGRGQK
jgi:SEC-C motif domain protein